MGLIGTAGMGTTLCRNSGFRPRTHDTFDGKTKQEIATVSSAFVLYRLEFGFKAAVAFASFVVSLVSVIIIN